MSAWKNADSWEVKDGVVTINPKGPDPIETKESFGDCQLHVEWAEPEVVKGSGQGRGNSGVFLMSRYEVQVLDSFHNKTYFDGQCGAIYKQYPPLVNVSRKPGEWQTYDIIFEAPKFDSDGKVTKPAYVTVLQNGVLVQNHSEIQGSTSYFKPPRIRSPSRQAAAGIAKPRQSGEVPQYMDPRNHADQLHHAAKGRNRRKTRRHRKKSVNRDPRRAVNT